MTFALVNGNIINAKFTKLQWFEISFQQNLTKEFISDYRDKLFDIAIKYKELTRKKGIVFQPKFVQFLIQECNILDKFSTFKFQKFDMPKGLFKEFFKFKEYELKFKKKSIIFIIDKNPLSIVLLNIRKQIKLAFPEMRKAFIKSFILKRKPDTFIYMYEIVLSERPILKTRINFT